MILLIGGARSGKSSVAVSAAGAGDEEVTFLATGKPSDPEMEERIAEHRRGRPDGWRVVEEPEDLAGALEAAGPADCVVVDCLTFWVSNLMENRTDREILDQSRRAAAIAAERHAPTIVVTNEVGSGVVPPNPVGRRFRDLQGSVNQIWADVADEVYLVVAGRLLALESADRLGLSG